MIDFIKHKIKENIYQYTQGIDLVVEAPKKGFADLAIPLFPIAKVKKMALNLIYEEVKNLLSNIDEIDQIEFQNGFLNIYLERKKLSMQILKEIALKKEAYGSQTIGDGQTLVIDYSSPNIAKSFSVGHLRSTMIGNAIKNIYEKLNYKVVSINHLGDWGTQFGKMIVAYQKWGDANTIKENPIIELQKLYVKFHDAAENDPSLEDEARQAFLKLEQNDQEHIRLWQWFKNESMREFMAMYELLGVSFDSFDGESFYNDKMEKVVEDLEKLNLLKVDQGATIVDLGEDLPPALIKKSDGATLYMTRDLSALLYRYQKYQFNHIFYVVGNEQILHFKQLKALSEKMGYQFDLEHINFGLVLIDGKKMSTRSGQYKRLEDVISKAIQGAYDAITSKNPHLKNKEEVAKAVGVGAIIFNDLKNERHLNIDFNLDNMLRFEGQTGPYLQYSSVRIQSILKEYSLNIEDVDVNVFEKEHYFEIVKSLSMFPQIILKAKEQNAPSIIARYILSLAQSFNSFYGKQRIISDDLGEMQANLLFIYSIQIVLNEGLSLLGIEALSEM
jgi:arginyl-tRNA synthetase